MYKTAGHIAIAREIISWLEQLGIFHAIQKHFRKSDLMDIKVLGYV